MAKSTHNKQRVLITGGAGYVGTVLTNYLLDHDFDIVLFDKMYFGHEPISQLKHSLTFIEGDIRDPNPAILDQVDTVIHLAGLSNDPTAEFNPQANREINTNATKRLATLAKRQGVKRFIFASSCSIYDLGVTEENGLKDETSPVLPRAAYAVSKRNAELALLPLADDQFTVVILRKGTVFGFSPRMRYDLVVNTMIKNALSTGVIKVFCRGLQWRPLVDVDDVARAYHLATLADPKKVNGEIINITLDNFLMKDLASLVQQILQEEFDFHVKIIFEQDDRKDRSYRVSGQKAKDLLGFEPKQSLKASIFKIINSIKEGKSADFSNPIYYNIEWMRPIFEQENQVLPNQSTKKTVYRTS